MNKGKRKIINWLIFLLLTIIWGSSFILMKEGLKALSPYQVAAIRIISAGILLLPVAILKSKKILSRQHFLIFITGLMGTFIPAFLFCIAETRISSAFAGFLNTLTPLFTIGISILVYRNQYPSGKLLGLLIGFAGMVILFFGQGSSAGDYAYAFLVVLSTVCYGLNVNIVNQYLKNTDSLTIVALAFSYLLFPAILILYFTGYFSLNFNSELIKATAASSVLGLFGTAMASYVFYVLLKSAGPLFASMVTYCIPFVALGWGLLAGETVSLLMMTGLITILIGVYITNRN
jgi:drug/metabolite transporter (DMT)-like permease